MKFTRLLLSLILAAISSVALGSLKIGSSPSLIKLEGDQGGRVDGKPWTSKMLIGKVHVLFYVDPDHKDLNQPLKAALKKESFDPVNYGSIAVINMDATWLPNGLIESSLESNQKEFPDVTYVKDMKKILVKKWSLKDDAFDVVVFGKKGEILMHQDGEFDQKNIDELLKLVKANL